MGGVAGIERTDAPYTFRREGDYWTVSYEGPPVRLRDRRGLGYIARLLERPGEDRHVLDVIGSCVVEGQASQARLGLGDAGNACDARARNEYRGRLADLEVELDDAREANDLGQVERLQREREQLARELARAFGVGGRPRRVAAGVERARINVRNSIVNALKAMEGREAGLFRHLRVSIRTGTYCAYRPERAMRWML